MRALKPSGVQISSKQARANATLKESAMLNSSSDSYKKPSRELRANDL